MAEFRIQDGTLSHCIGNNKSLDFTSSQTWVKSLCTSLHIRTLQGKWLKDTVEGAWDNVMFRLVKTTVRNHKWVVCDVKHIYSCGGHGGFVLSTFASHLQGSCLHPVYVEFASSPLAWGFPDSTPVFSPRHAFTASLKIVRSVCTIVSCRGLPPCPGCPPPCAPGPLGKAQEV